ncbi:MAG: dual specificity protein phosphatase family protein [Chlamydiales bacterium]|nr:dual specificity protein phosphatase family protein [Chlamydiales bacterium]
MQVDAVRDLIVKAQDPWVNGKKPKDILSNKHQAHHVVGGLYIGGDHSFVEVFQDNPQEFECVISACSFARMKRSQEALADITGDRAEALFKERKITWLQVGNAVPDDANSWPDIVFNATFPHLDDAQIGIEIRRREKNPTPDQVALRARKNAAILLVDVKEQFAPVFKALREGKKTLVHCHHGVSRSATILCAFFIHDFGVSAEQALAYLRTKRICVKPKLFPDLQQYFKALNQ